MNREAASLILAELVRTASREVRLIGEAELRAGLTAQLALTPSGDGPGPDLSDAGFADLLAEALTLHPDLIALEEPGRERRLFSTAHLSRTYAAILAAKDSPVRLLAETVRANSRDYPRPVPLSLFSYPPFNLPEDALHATLDGLTHLPEYRDIAQLATSTGAVYLYSANFLEPAYAAFLAERLDVGLSDNP